LRECGESDGVAPPNHSRVDVVTRLHHHRRRSALCVGEGGLLRHLSVSALMDRAVFKRLAST
jgi:hypothetical protein